MPTYKHPCPQCDTFIERSVEVCPACGFVDPFAPNAAARAVRRDTTAGPVTTPSPAPAPPTTPAAPPGQACSGCGASLAPGARFCTECGTLVGQ